MTIYRLAANADAQQIAAIYAPIVTDTIISFETQPPTAAEMAQRIEQTLTFLPWIVYEQQPGTLVGYAYASRHRSRAAYQWSVDVSVYVDAAWRGRGVGSKLYARLFAILRLQQFVNVYAGIALPNAASVRLHEKLGMRPIGVYRNVGYKFGRWHDVGWWHAPLGDYPAQPQPPIALPAVLEGVQLLLRQDDSVFRSQYS